MQIAIQQRVLIEFRPVFLVMLVISVLFLILSVIPRSRNSNLNFVTVLTVSFIQTILAGTLLYTESNVAESFDFLADRLTVYIFLGILILSIFNPIIFRSRNRGKSRYRY